MKKTNFVLVLFFCLSFSIFANGNKENLWQNADEKKYMQEQKFSVYKIKHKYCSVEIPKGANIGNFITIRFNSKKEIKRAWVSFINQNNNAIQTLRAFPINEKKTKWVAIAGIAVWWKPDLWQVKTKIMLNDYVFEDIKPFIVAKQKFPEFIMHLDQKNTKIITKKTKKKTIQRNRFKEVIKTKNYQAKLCPGPFIKPFKFIRISSFFAEKRVKKYTNKKSSTSRHWGMDYPARKGTVIKAPNAGKVVLAENRVVTGNTIILEHLPGIYTLYYHLNKIYVNEGDFLEQGLPMGEIGSTGFSTGPHLHWELRINEIPIDPRYLLERKLY